MGTTCVGITSGPGYTSRTDVNIIGPDKGTYTFMFVYLLSLTWTIMV